MSRSVAPAHSAARALWSRTRENWTPGAAPARTITSAGAESLTIVASNSSYRNARRQAAMAAGTFCRQAGGVLHPDPDREPVLRPVEGEAVVARPARGRHDEPPLVEVVADRRGDVAARRAGEDEGRRRSTGAGRSSGAPGEARRRARPAHPLGLGEAARLELVGREAVEVVAQRGHEIPLGEHGSAVVDARAREEARGAAGAEDSLLVRGPVPDAAGAEPPAELPVERTLETELQGGGAEGAEIGVAAGFAAVELAGGEAYPRARPDTRSGPMGSVAPSAIIGAMDWRTVISSTMTSRSRLLAPIAPSRA